jgi:hypothetical protein
MVHLLYSFFSCKFQGDVKDSFSYYVARDLYCFSCRFHLPYVCAGVLVRLSCCYVTVLEVPYEYNCLFHVQFIKLFPGWRQALF